MNNMIKAWSKLLLVALPYLILPVEIRAEACMEDSCSLWTPVSWADGGDGGFYTTTRATNDGEGLETLAALYFTHLEGQNCLPYIRVVSIVDQASNWEFKHRAVEMRLRIGNLPWANVEMVGSVYNNVDATGKVKAVSEYYYFGLSLDDLDELANGKELKVGFQESTKFMHFWLAGAGLRIMEGMNLCNKSRAAD